MFEFLIEFFIALVFISILAIITMYQLFNDLEGNNMRNLVLIVGASGSGKSFLQRKLIENYPDEFEMVTSATTRAMRDGERDGKDYHFLSEEEFKEWNFFETAYTGKHYYGTPKKEFFKSEKGIAHVIDPYGAYDLINNSEITRSFNVTIVFMDIAMEVILEHTNDKERLKRDETDNIYDRFKEKGLKADYTFTSFNDDNHRKLKQWLIVNKK